MAIAPKRNAPATIMMTLGGGTTMLVRGGAVGFVENWCGGFDGVGAGALVTRALA
jgi:hypothetical protein